jgi:hypothetical protein
MGGPLGRPPVALVSALLFVLVACSHDDDESRAGDPGGTSSTESAAQTTPALRPCSEDRHVVVFDFMGVLIEGNLEVFLPWIADGTVPATRPGARELVQAYRERGYEILYLAPTGPLDMFTGGNIQDVLTQWLQANGYPLDDSTHVWVWSGRAGPEDQKWITITDELIRLANEAAIVDFGYTQDVDKALAMASGGTPPDGLFSLTPLEEMEPTHASPPTSLIPGDDLVAHLDTVQQLPPVCQV